MINSGILVTYTLLVLGLMLIPGPAVLLTLARATSRGRRIGIATGLGIATGDLVHTIMATFGLSAVLATSALAFDVVKYAGVVYLIYLGIRAFVEKAETLDLPAVRLITAAQAYRQGIFAEVLNPKTALFFLAFLPQFVHPEKGSAIVQFAILGVIFVAISAAYTTMIALGAGSFGRWLRNNRSIGRWQGKIIGTLYVGLGIRLAFQQR